MKRPLPLLIATAVAALLAARSVSGQTSYGIAGASLTSGGRSQGGGFALDSTVGASVAGSATGDDLILHAGQWQAFDFNVRLPIMLKHQCPTFSADGIEHEPNNTGATANGPLCSGLRIAGFANDSYDVFYFNSAAGTITANVTNHVGQGVQLILYHQVLDAAHEVAKDTQGPGFDILHQGVGGKYYLSIFTYSGFEDTVPYELTVTLP